MVRVKRNLRIQIGWKLFLTWQSSLEIKLTRIFPVDPSPTALRTKERFFPPDDLAWSFTPLTINVSFITYLSGSSGTKYQVWYWKNTTITFRYIHFLRSKRSCHFKLTCVRQHYQPYCGNKGLFIPEIYWVWTIAWTWTFQSTQWWKMGTQPTIELFSPHKSWSNSKYECTHFIQYNPLFTK